MQGLLRVEGSFFIVYAWNRDVAYDETLRCVVQKERHDYTIHQDLTSL